MTDITLHNTRTRRKEPFRPIDPGNVRMYVCGPTVYDRAHIGNARPVVVFDVLYRLLRHRYGDGHVTYVRNFTDVDDRIIDKAVATRRPDETLEDATRRITDQTIGWYHEDMDALGALRPEHEPRCTEMIPQMVAMIGTLIGKGHAYAAEDHVLFAVESDPRYGRLSGRSVDDMIAGARVEVAPYKKNPMDFVLWKPSTPEQPGWDSPWGRGRPGWHIECSAMARELLGETFDIHAGGIDLQFPHHENELAQSCCAHGTAEMANVWMHNEMLRVEGEKMSKSLGNFFTVRDLLDRGIPGQVIRYLLLSTRYTKPLDWTEKRLQEARSLLDRWSTMKRKAVEAGLEAETRSIIPDPAVVDALADDLNTHEAFRILFGLQTAVQLQQPDGVLRFFGTLNWLGFSLDNLHGPAIRMAIEEASRMVRLAEQIDAARAASNYVEADRIRNMLLSAGYVVNTTKSGTKVGFGPDSDPSKLEALQ